MTLADYWRACRDHDWQYQNADDGRKWRAGHLRHTELSAMRARSAAHRATFDGWAAHAYSGPAYGTIRRPIPPLPLTNPAPRGTLPMEAQTNPDQLTF